MDKELDYPVAAPKDVAPVIYRAMIIQSMALQFFKYMQGSPEEFTMDEAFDAAKAVWETEWSDDPAPRTIESSREAVNDELAYWNEG